MSYAKTFSIAIFAALLAYGAAGFHSLPLASFEGDLTRMGLVPERLFGWQQGQPAIEDKWLQQAAIEDADMLVIGDSFSVSRAWQSVLTESGLKIRTEHWSNIRALCVDFAPWLRARGFNGRLVVVESVERNLGEELRKSVACQSMNYRPDAKMDAPRKPPLTAFDTAGGDYSGKMSIGLRTRLNALRYQHLSTAADFRSMELPNEVRLVRLPGACKLFSHARCDDILFLGKEQSAEASPDILPNMEILTKRLTGLTVIWAIVPNKSTVYLYPDNGKLWEAAEQRFLAPNLLRMSRQALERGTIDLFPANNTHFSTTGYLLMGEQMLRAIPPTK
ncbi:MAG: hypothetical protein WAV95_04655 [Azonexus sp.]